MSRRYREDGEGDEKEGMRRICADFEALGE